MVAAVACSVSYAAGNRQYTLGVNLTRSFPRTLRPFTISLRRSCSCNILSSSISRFFLALLRRHARSTIQVLFSSVLGPTVQYLSINLFSGRYRTISSNLDIFQRPAFPFPIVYLLDSEIGLVGVPARRCQLHFPSKPSSLVLNIPHNHIAPRRCTFCLRGKGCEKRAESDII